MNESTARAAIERVHSIDEEIRRLSAERNLIVSELYRNSSKLGDLAERIRGLRASRTPLENLGLAHLTVALLENFGICSIEELAGHTKCDLRAVPGLEEWMVTAVYEKAQEYKNYKNN